ncbi:MAG: DUF6036 family nucleotidyltransferase [Verrucomicrobiota bacterium]
MRYETDIAKLERFMEALGSAATSAGRVYFTGGATAICEGWRETTADIDFKPDPEPAGIFEAIPRLKEELEVNIELASPDQFIPELPGWRERSRFIATHGLVDFYHFDDYSQAMAKIERFHERDRSDVFDMFSAGLVNTATLRRLFDEIEPKLIRFPSINPSEFRRKLDNILRDAH